MDKNTLTKKYLACVKLLDSDATPNNIIADMLIDVISSTKLFADKLESQRRRKRRLSNAIELQKKYHDTRSRSGMMPLRGSSVASFMLNTSSIITKLSPRVRLTRLDTNNGNLSITDGIQHETKDNSKSESLRKKRGKIPPGRVRRKVYRRRIGSDENDSNGESQESAKRAKTEIPEKVRSGNSATESDVTESFEMNVCNRSLCDGCIIS